MLNIHDIQPAVPTLPLAEQLALRDMLDQQIDASLSIDDEAEQRRVLQLIEQRYEDYKAGIEQTVPWSVVMDELRKRLAL